MSYHFIFDDWIIQVAMMKKLLSIFATILIVGGMLSVTSHAGEQQDGLQAVITQDRTNYTAGENAEITLTVTNQGVWVAGNVRVQSILPKGLQFCENSDESAFAKTIQPGEQLALTINVEEIKNTDLSGGEESTPITGDFGAPWFLLIVFIGALLVAGLLYISIYKKSKLKH